MKKLMMRLIHFHLKGHCKVVFENETGLIFLGSSGNESLLLASAVSTAVRSGPPPSPREKEDPIE